MGTTLGLLNDSKKCDFNLLLNNYYSNFQLEETLRKDSFITLLVSTKDFIISEHLKISLETPLILKIFALESINYLKYSQEFKDIIDQYKNLKITPNVLPLLDRDFKKENFGVLIRQYIKYNLNDIQYHMHCVSEIEKKWICFQLLNGLEQIHSKSRCHGDIKPNNILLTSKLSVFLTDISVYKPVYLPIEDLQYYNTYFYSSEHDKSCYLAPERFIINSNDIKKTNELTPEMDIFSLGVVMSEIFLEKFSIFTQNDIINYKNKKIDLKDKLREIKDINIKKTLMNMLEVDPEKRIKLNDLIILFGDSLCPAPITKFMMNLNIMIVGYEYYHNDLLVALLYKHFQQIWKSLCIKNKNLTELLNSPPNLRKKLNRKVVISLLNNVNTIYKTTNKFPLAFIPNENKETFVETEINENFFQETTREHEKSLKECYNTRIINEDSNNDCTIIIIKYLLSCLENTKYISTYSVIFEMIFNLSKILIKNDNSVIILDIIVPYYINLFKFGNSRLSIEAFNSLIDLLFLIDYNKLILNPIDYNSFNEYIFEKIYRLYFDCNQLEVQCAIISRLDSIIELENNFLFSYINTIKFITKEKEEEKDNLLKKSHINSASLFQSLLNFDRNNAGNKRKEKTSNKINFDDMYKSYLGDMNGFKIKLKKIIENIMVDNIIKKEEEEKANNDCLKLLLIKKYKDICLFIGNYHENMELFNYLFILFNRDNYFIQKEIIRIFPSLILLYGRKLYFDYFLPFIELTCQKKNSELMIMEIVNALYILMQMDLICHDDDYFRTFSLLIPYLLHPNYLLRHKLHLLFQSILSNNKNLSSQLYIYFNHNIKKILIENKIKNSENEKKLISIINVIDIELINLLKDRCFIPREIFLLYKYNIESALFNSKYSYLESSLKNITKVKPEHFCNKIKNDISQKILGLITKNEILNIKEKKFYDMVVEDLKKILINSGGHKEKDSAFFQTNFINTLTFLFDELNKNDGSNKKFLDRWYCLCGNQTYKNYSNILYLLKVLNYKLDKKNIEVINFMQTTDDNFNYDNTFKDFMLISGLKIKSINLNMRRDNNFLRDAEAKAKFCYKLSLNESESIIKLIPVNNFLGKEFLNMFISISDEGMIRLHLIYNEPSFDDVYTLKNRSQYQVDCGDNILKTNKISYIEQPNRIIIIIAIQKKLELVIFELNNETNNKNNMEDLEISYAVNNIECISSKEIIAIENIYNNKRNYLALGNNDNTISFYNYIDNKINYINNCTSFYGSYGSIESLTTLSTTNNILVTTSHGFIVLYDFNLRLFTYVYSFSIKRKIKQIIEYIPRDFNDLIFEQLENKKLDNEKGFIYILTEDNDITLLNLSLLKPIIVCRFYETNKIDEYKKKTDDVEILKISKLSLKTNEENEFYINKVRSDYSILDITKKNKIVKMDIPMSYYDECSYSSMLIGDNSGNVRIFRFSFEILNKIKKKEGHKNNKFNQFIISDENLIIESRTDSKFKKSEGVFINKNIYSIKKKEIEEFWVEEMNDLLLMKDFMKNITYVISCYSNGLIKLYTL